MKAKALEIESREVPSFHAEKQTLARYLEQWLVRVKNKKAPRTHERYQAVVNKYIAQRMGALR